MEPTTTFINIQTDYGFKKIFGTKENKHILIRFLNALFEDTIKVTDVVYHDKEILPDEEEGKRIIYDIYCTANDGSHHFILEMQNCYQYLFEDRVLYYTARALAGQGHKGWDYDLKTVVSVVLTDFDFKGLSPALKHDMVMADRATGEILSEKMRIIFLSLARMEEKLWCDCHNEIERLLFLIKNIDKMDKNSEIYKSGDYEDLFNAAETDNLACEEMISYSRSLSYLNRVKRGVEQFRQEYVNEGIEQERINGIKRMAALGIPAETIAQSYDCPTEEIMRILKQSPSS